MSNRETQAYGQTDMWRIAYGLDQRPAVSAMSRVAIAAPEQPVGDHDSSPIGPVDAPHGAREKRVRRPGDEHTYF